MKTNLPFMKLLPVHSTAVVTSTFVDTALAQVMHVRVFTENTPPLGTSGVRVVVSVVTYWSKSTCSISSLISHFVCLGPRLPFKGLMYDMFFVSSFEPSETGVQSDICRSKQKQKNALAGTHHKRKKTHQATSDQQPKNP